MYTWLRFDLMGLQNNNNNNKIIIIVGLDTITTDKIQRMFGLPYCHLPPHHNNNCILILIHKNLQDINKVTATKC